MLEHSFDRGGVAGAIRREFLKCEEDDHIPEAGVRDIGSRTKRILDETVILFDTRGGGVVGEAGAKVPGVACDRFDGGELRRTDRTYRYIGDHAGLDECRQALCKLSGAEGAGV